MQSSLGKRLFRCHAGQFGIHIYIYSTLHYIKLFFFTHGCVNHTVQRIIHISITMKFDMHLFSLHFCFFLLIDVMWVSGFPMSCVQSLEPKIMRWLMIE